MSTAEEGCWGIGLIEGWRGPVLLALEAGKGGKILRCHPHDPSWQNWPVLEDAIIDNIVPDFPAVQRARALCIRAIDAGSCNGCELEMQTLGNPIYNLEALGIRFVASPRHADLLPLRYNNAPASRS